MNNCELEKKVIASPTSRKASRDRSAAFEEKI